MTRDMTHAQFKAAAARNGFRLGPLGLCADNVLGDGCGVSYGYVMRVRPKPIRVLRRESLAKAIQQRDLDHSRGSLI